MVGDLGLHLGFCFVFIVTFSICVFSMGSGGRGSGCSCQGGSWRIPEDPGDCGIWDFGVLQFRTLGVENFAAWECLIR